MKDGEFDQVGTPEEIVANPATDYVREFTTDVPRAKVLRARALATPGGPAPRTVPADALLETVIPMLLDRDEPVGVVDADGRNLGVIDRRAVAGILAAERR